MKEWGSKLKQFFLLKVKLKRKKNNKGPKKIKITKRMRIKIKIKMKFFFLLNGLIERKINLPKWTKKIRIKLKKITYPNWRIKLKTNKKFTKKSKTKIWNQNIRDQRGNSHKSKDNYENLHGQHEFWDEERKDGIAGNKPCYRWHHAPL